MKLFGTIAVTLVYYAMILMAGIWYDLRAAGLVIAASICVALVSHLIEEDEDQDEYECQNEEFPRHDSCDGCFHNLGGGCCAINVERECREGGGFELYTEELR